MSYLLALALLLASFGAQGQPAIQEMPSAESGSEPCGSNQVTWTNVRTFQVGTPGSASLQVVTGDGSVVLDMSQDLTPGEVLIPRWCADLLGDGSEVLAYEMYSGGAHCCFTATLVLLEAGAPELLNVELGNGGIGRPTRLSDDGSLQVLAGSDVFAYFDSLSFAASPFMPMIFAYDGNEYFEATRLFPAYLRDQSMKAESDLANAKDQQVQESVALRLYGLHVLLGDADSALPTIESRLSPPAAEWLGANAQAAADAINAAYNQ